MGTGKVSTGTPVRLRSFDPVRLADLEYRAWTGYYLRKWPQVLRASFGLVRLGFGIRTMVSIPIPDAMRQRSAAWAKVTKVCSISIHAAL